MEGACLTSPGFVSSPDAIFLGLTARTFGRSPARDYLGVEDPVLALAVDEAVALRLAFEEQAQRSKKHLKGSIPEGQRYETVEESLEATRYSVGLN